MNTETPPPARKEIENLTRQRRASKHETTDNLDALAKEYWPYWIGAVVGLAIICYVLLYFSEAQIPTIFQSSGVVAIISAFIGILLTIFVTQLLLKGQSKADAQRDKDVKIYKRKVDVYSEFVSHLAGLIDKITIYDKVASAELTDKHAEDRLDKEFEEELQKLRTLCFKRLVFYLSKDQVEGISAQLLRITSENEVDMLLDATGEIIHILQKNIDPKMEKIDVEKLYWSFSAKLKPEKNKPDSEKSNEPVLGTPVAEKPQESPAAEKAQEPPLKTPVTESNIQLPNNLTFWHFNMLGDAQIAAFKKDPPNWRLALIEYNEIWRTNLLKRVKPGDVVFLRRKGYGYIAAFRAVEPEVFNPEKPKTCDEEDIYGGLADGATSVANIRVKPIAFNYTGLASDIVRRRTIETMNLFDTKILLKGFKDPRADNPPVRAGINHIDKDIPVKSGDLDAAYFEEVFKKYVPGANSAPTPSGASPTS